jgi:hypothetical protein
MFDSCGIRYNHIYYFKINSDVVTLATNMHYGIIYKTATCSENVE